MSPKMHLVRFSLVVIGLCSTASAADAPKAKVTFEEVSAQVFKTRCNSCHNADKQKGGLNLETYSTAVVPAR